MTPDLVVDALPFGLAAVERGQLVYENAWARSRLTGADRNQLLELAAVALAAAEKPAGEVWRWLPGSGAGRLLVACWRCGAESVLLAVLPEALGPLADVRRLEDLNRELEAIFEFSSDAIYVTDGDGITLRTNPALCRLDGVPPDYYLGRPVRELEAEGAFSPSVTLEVLRHRRRVTMMQTTRAGRRLMVTGNPVFDEHGNLLRVVSNVRDLTELAEMEERLHEQDRLIERYEQELSTLRQQASWGPGLVARDARMRAVVDLAQRAARVKTPVLICGERGTGKDVLARLIHRTSGRSQEPFQVVSCGTLPPDRVAAELFGSPETGLGRAGLAHGGTLFLKDVEALPPDVQLSLADMVDRARRGRAERQGDGDPPPDFRLLASTREDPDALLRSGQLHPRLYYLFPVTLMVPPLRERPEDILPLARAFLKQVNEAYGLQKRFSPGVLQAFLRYPWPGNVRELESVVERLAVLEQGDLILVESLPPGIQQHARSDGLTLRLPAADGPTMSLADLLRRVEAEAVRSAYAEHGSSYKVAAALNISQSSAHRKILKYCRPGRRRR